MKLFQLDLEQFGYDTNYLFYKDNTTDETFQSDVKRAIKSIDLNTNKVIDCQYILQHVITSLCNKQYIQVETFKVAIKSVDLYDSRTYIYGNSNKDKVLKEVLDRNTILTEVFSAEEIYNIIEHNSIIEEASYIFRCKRSMIIGANRDMPTDLVAHLDRMNEFITDMSKVELDELLFRINTLYEYRDNNYFGFNAETFEFNDEPTLDILNDFIEGLLFEDIMCYDDLDTFKTELIIFNKILNRVFEK